MFFYERAFIEDGSTGQHKMGSTLTSAFALQNSPLFRYLHDLGHTDFETCPTAARDQDGDLASGDVPRKAQVSPDLKREFETLGKTT